MNKSFKLTDVEVIFKTIRMKHILILAISLRLCVCRFAVQERQWTENDNRENCTNICEDTCRYCPDPKVCNDEQLKCGETYHVDDVHGIMYDCMPDEICIPEGCLCKEDILMNLHRNELILVPSNQYHL